MHVIGYFSALAIGLSLGLIGGGGSILTVPILVYLFGIDAVMATAYSLFVVGFSSAIGMVSHYRKGNVRLKAGMVFGIPSIFSVYAARKFLVPAIPHVLFRMGGFTVTKPWLLLILFALLMLSASYFMIRNPQKKLDELPERKFNYPMLMLQGVIVGAVTGFLGAGGGFLIIPSLVLMAGLPMKQAVGTSLLVMTLSALLGFTGDMQEHANINYGFLLFFSSIAGVGIIIGSYLTKYISNQKLKPAFGWFVLMMGIYIIIKELLVH